MENHLVPYTASALPAGPWLIFAPHADDETFGMGGSLLLASQQGIETHVAFLTDGALGGDENATDLIEKRIREATEATDALGVGEIYFFAEPDRGLQVNERMINKVSELIEKIQPASVFFPMPLEFHPDHRVTTELVWKSIQGLKSFSGDAYSYEISTQAPINLLIDVSEVALEKYKIIKLYASQLTQAKYLALVQALDTARTHTLPIHFTAAEGYFKFTDRGASIEEQLNRSITAYFQGLNSSS